MYRAMAVILVFIGLMICPSAYADLREGLVAAWTFDDGTAREACHDMVTNQVVFIDIEE